MAAQSITTKDKGTEIIAASISQTTAAMARTKANAAAQSSATIAFEAKLWLTADKLRVYGGGLLFDRIYP